MPDTAEENILKRLRLAKKLSLRKLAQLADLDQSTISGIENGRKKAQAITLQKLAEALDVDFSVIEPLMDTGASQRGRLGGQATAKKETASLKMTVFNTILAV